MRADDRRDLIGARVGDVLLSLISSSQCWLFPLAPPRSKSLRMTEAGQQIEEFVAAHPEKKVVVVQGLGFVGAVMALVVATAPFEEYAVIGVDLPTDEPTFRTPLAA